MSELLQSAQDSPRVIRPRIWPGVAMWVMVMVALTVPGLVAPRTMFHFMGMMLGDLLAIGGTVLWWLFFSRTSWLDRLSVLAVFIGVGMGVGSRLHSSQAMAVLIYAFPIVLTLWVGWLLISGSLSWPTRRAILMVLIALGWSTLVMVRIKNIDGNMIPDVAWRWSKTSEQLMTEEFANRKPTEQSVITEPVVTSPGDWPEFRGTGRDSKATGVRIRTDWDVTPPKLLWKHRLGLGWSSFAVVGNRLFTQEQRLSEECVVCYSAETGDELWKAALAVRFIDGVGGDGPRATPTIRDGRLYAQGATGQLVCLDAATGNLVWKRDIGADADAKPPQWGYSGSPLVVDDLVIALPAGVNNKGTSAYRRTDGELVWTSGEAQHTYSSPQEATFFGVKQILVLSDFGLESFNVADGKLLWSYPQTMRGMNRVVQPHIIGEGEVLLGTGTGLGLGTKLIKARRNGDSWTAEAGWNSPKLKPYFNDFVTHSGYAYGFDDSIFACISLKDGKSTWREGRYGHGQVLLLEDQAKLLIISDAGKVILLEANPEEHTELGSFQALTGKTWNHPVVVRGKLFVRNDEEMACYDVAETSMAGK